MRRFAVGLLLVAAGCAGESAATAPPSPPATSAATDTIDTSTSTTTSTTTSATTTSTTTTTAPATTTTTTGAPTTTSSSTSTTVEPLPDPWFTSTNAVFDGLAAANPAASLTVVRDGTVVLSRASGTTIDGAPVTSATPMVVASVGKLVTASMVARLDRTGAIDVDAPMPWGDLGLPAHLAWFDVTPREMLDHVSGMPVVRFEWFDGGLDCAGFLPSLLDRPPTATRGRWTYSNGNYCALGLLVEHVTGLPLDEAARSLLPLTAGGVHLTTGGQLPSDVEYRPGVARLSRLGGAGAFIVSTEDMAALLAALTPEDLEVMTWPGLFVDQYGWGHTGSVDEAVACAWVLDGGRTVVAATVAGPSPSTGGALCDRVVPALAADLGLGQGVPDRSPP